MSGLMRYLSMIVYALSEQVKFFPFSPFPEVSSICTMGQLFGPFSLRLDWFSSSLLLSRGVIVIWSPEVSPGKWQRLLAISYLY